MNSPRDQVIKIGGANLDDPDHLAELVQFVRGARDSGARIVLVHGGGKEIGAYHDRLGVPFRKDEGLRVTSKEGMDITSMVLSGLVNKRLVAFFRNTGLKAVGISGADLGIRSDFLDEGRYGRVGHEPEVETEAMSAMLDVGEIVIISPVCLAPDGGLLNINADVAARAIAVALRADRLDFVTDVEAVRSRTGPVRQTCVRDVEELMKDSIIEGGMIPKLESALAAIGGGVGCVRVGSFTSLTDQTATEVSA